MRKHWDGADLIKMMISNEKAVASLYRRLAADSKIGGKFLEHLALDEDRHHDMYSQLLKKLEGTPELTVEISEEHEQYLKLLIERNMLKDTVHLMDEAKKITNKDDLFDLAERIERDSVLFVQELISLYPKLQPDEFKAVLREEKDHLRQVLNHRMESQLATLRL
ncbi:hypothetical protein [Leptolinea tardivitalis]|uniref:Rubrerythrin diiron-binding domain-containing protein n=1 Tax=Leptolinea tardivitalis TaxID=229920 RepID=A0A0P6X5S2_9CHLR|nr:hypothetical protein [Leptolinea tardivitalis]KPL70260.1 hypothetical protein ADM99_13895 [Leptolinea tardivitalis]GAP21812.1 hypothetical protein LTAR_02029 [Leptolinea tardivitalis]